MRAKPTRPVWVWSPMKLGAAEFVEKPFKFWDGIAFRMRK